MSRGRRRAAAGMVACAALAAGVVGCSVQADEVPAQSPTSSSQGSTSGSGSASSAGGAEVTAAGRSEDAGTTPGAAGAESSSDGSSISDGSSATADDAGADRAGAPDEPLQPGDSGPEVRDLQRQLSDLGYWLGTADGTYGHSTAQAVLALQKSAGLDRDGVAGEATLEALAEGTSPPLQGGPADRVEIDLHRQVLQVVADGERVLVLNTSTGSGEYFTSDGYTRAAVTPPGTFAVDRVYDGVHTGSLGSLYRPRYFNQGIAVHGAPSIPGYPASHGCARVSNAAMDMLWAQDHLPVGGTVVVH